MVAQKWGVGSGEWGVGKDKTPVFFVNLSSHNSKFAIDNFPNPKPLEPLAEVWQFDGKCRSVCV